MFTSTSKSESYQPPMNRTTWTIKRSSSRILPVKAIGFQLMNEEESSDLRSEKVAEIAIQSLSDVLVMDDIVTIVPVQYLQAIVRNNGTTSVNPQQLKLLYRQYFSTRLMWDDSIGVKSLRECLAVSLLTSENEMQRRYSSRNGSGNIRSKYSMIESAFEQDLKSIREKIALPLSEDALANMLVKAEREEKVEQWKIASRGLTRESDKWFQKTNEDLSDKENAFLEEQKKAGLNSQKPPMRVYEFEEWFFASLFKAKFLKQCYELFNGGSMFAISSICEYQTIDEKSSSSSSSNNTTSSNSETSNYKLINLENLEKSKALKRAYVDQSFEVEPLSRMADSFLKISSVLEKHEATITNKDDDSNYYVPENVVIFGPAGTGKRTLLKSAIMASIRKPNSTLRVLVVKRDEIRNVQSIANFCAKNDKKRFAILFDFAFNLQPFAEFHNALVNCQWSSNALLLATAFDASLVKENSTEAEKSALSVHFPLKISLAYSSDALSKDSNAEFERDCKEILARAGARSDEIDRTHLDSWLLTRTSNSHPKCLRAASQYVSGVL
jgi:hypothetical protein